MQRLTTAGLVLALLAPLPSTGTAADVTVTMKELSRNLDAYVGKHVVVTDCLMINTNDLSGAQCSVDPIDAGTLVYIDADTWTAQAKKIAEDCETAIIENMCVLKVTGEVEKNRRDQPLILGATVEIVKWALQRT